MDKSLRDEVLRECPCCGATPTIRTRGSDWTKSRKVTIKCPECRLERTDATIRNDMAWVTNVAITAWNRRHPVADDVRDAGMENRLVGEALWRAHTDLPDDYCVTVNVENFAITVSLSRNLVTIGEEFDSRDHSGGIAKAIDTAIDTARGEG